MRKLLILFVLSMMWHSCIGATDFYFNGSNDPCCECNLVGTFDVGAGYRQDRLRWVFPGPTSGIAIHEKWNHISFAYLEGNARLVAFQRYLLKVDLGYGWSGWQKKHHSKFVNYDTEEETNNRKDTTTGNVYDISAGLGYRLDLSCRCFDFALTPLAGWSFHHLKFKNSPYYDVEQSEKLRSTYFWSGPWVGFETVWQVCCPFRVYFDYSFHFGKFHATLNELERSHKKELTAFGNEFEGGAFYEWCDFWVVGLKFVYRDYWSNRYHSIMDYINGKKHSKFARWHSYTITADIGYIF
jgi:hypothetical protein